MKVITITSYKYYFKTDASFYELLNPLIFLLYTLLAVLRVLKLIENNVKHTLITIHFKSLPFT